MCIQFIIYKQSVIRYIIIPIVRTNIYSRLCMKYDYYNMFIFYVYHAGYGIIFTHVCRSHDATQLKSDFARALRPKTIVAHTAKLKVYLLCPVIVVLKVSIVIAIEL